jgi:hypothetical protein
MKPINTIQHLRIVLMLIAYKINLGVIMNFKANQFIATLASKIFIDRGFQRKACWTDKTCREFILSANKGRAPYPVVVADVSSGLFRSQNEGDAVSQQKYEQIKMLSKDWVSLDGQNRIEAFRRLFNNELTLTGTFIDADGCSVGVKNDYFKDLPVRLQDALKDCEITVIIMQNCLYSELHDIFVNINGGEPLNEQEKRNAIDTPISSVIRDHSERPHVREMFEKMNMKDSWFKRSLDAEWVAMMYLFTLGRYETNCKSSDLNNLYKIGKGKFFKQVPEYSGPMRTRFVKIINLLSSVVNSSKKSKNPLSQKEFWGMLIVCEYLIDNGIDITDYQGLASLIVDINTKLSNESHLEFSKAVTKAEELGHDLPSKSDYYFFYQSVFKDMNSRNKRRKKLIGTILLDERFTDLQNLSEEEEEVA